LGLAYKEINLDEREYEKQISHRDENNLVFLGLVTMVDPPRPEAKRAIQAAINAGIKPIMITGDHQNTAIAIARDVGIFRDQDLAVNGNELDRMHLEDLSKVIKRVSVYARVSPEHKIKIVEALQKNREIVAFVGDGINDAPAIRKADIGISMGLSGTEVSKEASSIILTDDNYYTIIKAVRNGRKIYNNIQNAITFLISGNAAAIILVVYTSLLSLPIPFAPVHLLFINLLTDSLPAIAIGMEENDEDLLMRPPRNPDQSLLSRHVLKIIGFEGILIAIFTIISYQLGLKTDHYVARTMVFGTLCIARLFHSFNCRGTKSIFKKKVRNKAMIWSFIVGMLLINLALFLPLFQKIFFAFPLNLTQTIMMFVNAIMPTIIIQIILIIKNKKRKK
jgi:Ca2+-transporting ATPase